MKVDKNIILWLQTILFERFGNDFDVEITEEGWIIKQATNDKVLRIVFFDKFYQLGKADFGVFQWDSEQEGWRSPLNKPLSVLGEKDEQDQSKMIELDASGATINFDILGLTYWCLSRSEEVGRDDLDFHERFPAQHSHAYQNNYLERPIVDEWLNLLGQIIEKVWLQIKLKQHNFEVKVSHDVDAPSQFGFVDLRRFIRRCGASILLDKNIKNVLLAPFVRLFTKDKLLKIDGYNSFDWLMSLSEKYNLKSAFYFISGRTDAHKDADYDLDYPAIRNLMSQIQMRGHEIGMHSSYNTFKSIDRLKSELACLKNNAKDEGIELSEIGVRMHYLRWQQPYTLQALNDAGFVYDTSMTYADHAGFRCGTCYEYPAINPVTKEILKLRIRPLIAMECSVIGKEYMGLRIGEEAENKFIELAEKCRQVGGCFTTLWHNSEFSDKRKKVLYETMLSKLVA